MVKENVRYFLTWFMVKCNTGSWFVGKPSAKVEGFFCSEVAFAHAQQINNDWLNVLQANHYFPSQILKKKNKNKFGGFK